MDFQKQYIIDKLFKLGWKLLSEVHPTSFPSWKIYEILTFEMYSEKIYISFLCDPMLEKSKERVDTVGLAYKEPNNHYEATAEGEFCIAKKWEQNIQDLFNKLKSRIQS